jgi:hypothetical protein
MKSFNFNTTKDFKSTYIRNRLFNIINMLNLPIFIIKGSKLKESRRDLVHQKFQDLEKLLSK